MKLAVRIAALAVCIGAAGCWPWHQEETPQQRFIEALNRGHSAEASQIWLHMSPRDKLQFANSQAMQPGTNPEDVKNLVTKHYEEQAQGAEGAEDTSGETVEGLGAPVGGAGLQNLPSLATPPPAAGN